MKNDGVNGVGRTDSTGAEDPVVGTLREYQELWFALRKRGWMSVVLVPVDPDGSAAKIGKALADVGSRLSEIPVTAISVTSMGYDSAFALADLQQHVVRDWRSQVDPSPVINVTGRAVSRSEPTAAGEAPPAPRNGSTETIALTPAARLVITIPAVISEPLGLAAAHAADATILVVEVGRTRLADARRTVELIGRERIAGCFIVR